MATIRKYAAEYLNEEESLCAGRVAGEGEEREIFTQTLNGWDSMNILRNYIPAIPVQDLTLGERDRVTAAVCEAAMSDGGENGNWYWYGFTGEAPIAAGPQALGNFGPLRSGFLSIRELEVVDVFGQRMRLKTKHLNQDGSLEVTPLLRWLLRWKTKEIREKYIFLRVCWSRHGCGLGLFIRKPISWK